MDNVVWASEFREILPVILERQDLRERMSVLLTQNTPGKVTEGGDRVRRLRIVLNDLFMGRLSLSDSYNEVSRQLPRHSSIHRANNRVFASGWEERLVRIQLSRLYNQAVLESLTASGQRHCFVPHSSEEDPATPCSVNLAGMKHEVAILLERLVKSYTHGHWTRELKIPDHPHCTHVVKPIMP